MKAFVHKTPSSIKEAVTLLSRNPGKALPIAAGSDLLGEMKDRIETPEMLVSLRNIPGLDKIQQQGDAVSIGAMVSVVDVAESDMLRAQFPVLAEAAAVIASPQIRNVGTVGGNLCQRPRCWYYRSDLQCLRKGGKICYAAAGENKYHAILGGGPSYIVHPSDLAPALISLDAKARIAGPAGTRIVPLGEFFVLPKVNLRRENILKPDEILTEIIVPVPAPGTRSTYWKHMEREAWDFALVSVAAAIRQRDGRVEHARVVMGGVAPIPWRSHEAEAALIGKSLDAATVSQAAEEAMKAAHPLRDNAFKVDLSRVIIRDALLRLA